MPYCSDCNKFLPPEPKWPPDGKTVHNAVTIAWEVHGVDIDGGKYKLCLHCWDVKIKLDQKKW